MNNHKDSHQPTDTAWFAVFIVFIIHCIAVFNIPFQVEQTWMKKAFIAIATFVIGGMIYAAAMESVASLLKKLVEIAWALFLLPMVLIPVLVYDGWEGHKQFVIFFGVQEKAAPAVVILGTAAGIFIASCLIWLVMYPISMIAGSDPRKLKEDPKPEHTENE